MKVHTPLPRHEYPAYLQALGDECAFCTTKDDLLIAQSTHWRWMFAAFPYRKHHTLLVPMRHVLHFAELSAEELVDLAHMLDQAEATYRQKKLVGTDSPLGDQLFISWRSRLADPTKKPVAHFHIHLYPKFGSEENNLLDPEASDFDTTILR